MGRKARRQRYRRVSSAHADQMGFLFLQRHSQLQCRAAGTGPASVELRDRSLVAAFRRTQPRQVVEKPDAGVCGGLGALRKTAAGACRPAGNARSNQQPNRHWLVNVALIGKRWAIRAARINVARIARLEGWTFGADKDS